MNWAGHPARSRCPVFFDMNLVLSAWRVEGVAGLLGDFHQGFEADPDHAVLQGVLAYDFGKIFAANYRGIAGIGHADKKALAYVVAQFRGVEINPAAGDADRAAQIIEVFLIRIGRTNAHYLSDLAAAAAAALGYRGSRGWASGGQCLLQVLLQEFVPGCHGKSPLP